MSTVRVAIIGVGLIGPRHAEAVVKSSSAELVAVVDPASAGSEVASKLGVSHFKSIEELLKSNKKPDAAIICTPNHTHVAVATELSSAGVHILVEKPISTDIPSGKAFLEHLSHTNVKCLVGHHRRFNPHMIAAKDVVSSGSLGRILGINGVWALYKPSSYFESPTEWRKGKTGGVILINMVHEVDLLHYLFGRIASVHAEKTLPQRGHEAHEGAVMTLKFTSGVVGSFFVCDNVPSPWNFESGTGENPLIPTTGQDFYRIFGTDASLSVPDMTVWSYKGAEKSWHSELTQEREAVPGSVPFENQVDHFSKVVRSEESPSCSAQAGLAALIVCEAITKALETGVTVQIEDYNL